MWFGETGLSSIQKDSLADIVIFNLQWLANRMSDLISYKYRFLFKFKFIFMRVY